MSRAHVRFIVSLLVSVSCKQEAMSSPTPKTFSAFTPLHDGFSQAIAPGAQLVTLGAGAGATWWEHDAPVSATLPPNTPVDGTRWTPDGKSLRVGLGTLDLAARKWTADPALASWAALGPNGEVSLKAVAWFADTKHVALLLESRSRDGKRTTEVVIAAADGKARGRRAVDGASALVASADRVMVAATKVVVLDLDAKVVAEPTPMPLSVYRVREGAGMFAAIGAAGAVALVRPSDAAVLASWDGRALDVVPLAHGVVAVDREGKVRVGCLDGNAIRATAEVASDVRGAVIQLIGDRLVLAGAGKDPVRVATFVNPCP